MFAKTLIALFAVAPLLGAFCIPQEKEDAGLVCQGQYSIVDDAQKGSPKIHKLDEWKMYHRADGGYSVEIPLHEDARFKERLQLTRELKPMELSLVVATVDAGTMRFFCDVSTAACSSSPDSTTPLQSLRIEQKMPYAWAPIGEFFPLYDVPWFYQSLVSQAEHSVGKRTRIPIISFITEAQVKQILEVEYLGRERVEILERKLLAHKYHIRDLNDPKRPEQDLWVSSTGIVLKATAAYPLLWKTIILTTYEGQPLE